MCVHQRQIMVRLYHDQKQHQKMHDKRVPPTSFPNRVSKCANRTTDRNSRRTIQHRNVHLHRYIRCTLSDEAQHLIGKKLFCKLHWSQAHHCLQMADQRSVELLAFNFASKTFGYKRLAQGLSRALPAFSSFMRDYLDKEIKADQCAQYVDDIGIAVNSVAQLIHNIGAVFECIRNAGLKLTIE